MLLLTWDPHPSCKLQGRLTDWREHPARVCSWAFPLSDQKRKIKWSQCVKLSLVHPHDKPLPSQWNRALPQNSVLCSCSVLPDVSPPLFKKVPFSPCKQLSTYRTFFSRFLGGRASVWCNFPSVSPYWLALLTLSRKSIITYIMKNINEAERKETVSPHSIGLFPLSYAMNLVQNADL